MVRWKPAFLRNLCNQFGSGFPKGVLFLASVRKDTWLPVVPISISKPLLASRLPQQHKSLSDISKYKLVSWPFPIYIPCPHPSWWPPLSVLRMLLHCDSGHLSFKALTPSQSPSVAELLFGTIPKPRPPPPPHASEGYLLSHLLCQLSPGASPITFSNLLSSLDSTVPLKPPCLTENGLTSCLR